MENRKIQNSKGDLINVIYALINQKGGVSKTSTSAALFAGLNARGRKTLAVDIDPQSNLTAYVGANRENKTILGMLTRETTAKEAIQHTPMGDFIASSPMLSGANSFLTETGKEFRLKEALEPIISEYDHIIIDTPPQLGILTINALTACDRIIIPATADAFSIQGVSQLSDTINVVKKYCNRSLTVSGILLCRFNARTLIAQSIADDMNLIAEKLGTKVFDTRIREGVAIKEAQLKQKSIFDYAPKAAVTEDYGHFIDELLLSEKEQ